VGDPPLSAARHRQVVERATRARVRRLVVPAAAATVLTGSAVGLAVAQPWSSDQVQQAAHQAPASISAADNVYLADRVDQFSRSTQRTTMKALPKVTGKQYLAAPLNVWATPHEKGKPLDVLKTASTVDVTGVQRHGFAQIVLDRQVRWVNASYLQDHKPQPKPKPTAAAAPTGGITDAPCPVSSSIESGLLPDADKVYRAVCANFPQVQEYGGYRPDGEHSHGQAVDIMVYGDSGTGQAIADWLRAHASELNLYDVIWQQHIWTPERSSEGWRLMPDRGSPTANHMDHVHVAVNY